MSPIINTLFKEAERLDNRSLDTFISNMMTLRIRRNEFSDKQKEEAYLFEKINKGLPLHQIERFKKLNDKRKETFINEEENNELIVLLEKIEKLNVNRLKYLNTLARLRNVSVRELMIQLSLNV